MKNFFRKNICVLTCIVLLLCVFSACGKKGGEIDSSYEEDIVLSYGFEGEIGGISFALPDMGTDVSFKSRTQESFLNQLNRNLSEAEESGTFDNDNVVGCYDAIHRYANGIAELSIPDPVVLRWTAAGDKEIVRYEVNVSENKEYLTDSGAADLSFCAEETEVAVYNLKAATVYYWNVTAVTGDERITSREACFTTSFDMPRNIYCDGVTNFRDLGGYKTARGKRVKQGLIFRCAALNYKANIGITAGGLETLEMFGIKTEIDLRGDEESGYISQGYLGNDMAYFRVPMVYEGNALTDNAEQIKEVFEILAEEDNYPLIFHCAIGTDRTGVIAFLINGLLGVGVNDLYLDYVWSNFGNIGSSRSAELVRNNYVWLIEEYEGKEFKDKVYNYLYEEVGVKKLVLNKIIYILTER